MHYNVAIFDLNIMLSLSSCSRQNSEYGDKIPSHWQLLVIIGFQITGAVTTVEDLTTVVIEK